MGRKVSGNYRLLQYYPDKSGSHYDANDDSLDHHSNLVALVTAAVAVAAASADGYDNSDGAKAAYAVSNMNNYINM